MRRALGTVALSSLLALAALAGQAPAGPVTGNDPPPPTRFFPPAGSPTLDAVAPTVPAPIEENVEGTVADESELDAIESADPCDVGRAIGRMGACLNPEDCPALRLWERRFGPERPVPVAPERRGGATSAAAAGERSPGALEGRRGGVVYDFRAAPPHGSALSPRPAFAPCPAGIPPPPER